MIDFVKLRQQKPVVVGEAPRNAFPTDIQIGDTYIARDKREREGRLVRPVTVVAVTVPIVGNALGRVTLRHPTRTTSVRLDRFREHYVQVTGNSNGSN